jgi:DNA-directed RNA polymerase sigma subunit (sigma70/sigma32)
MTTSLCLFCRAAFVPAKLHSTGHYCSRVCKGRDIDYDATWEQIGAALGVRKSRAQQIAAEALRKLAPLMEDCR